VTRGEKKLSEKFGAKMPEKTVIRVARFFLTQYIKTGKKYTT
jgi:hypothetical protein